MADVAWVKAYASVAWQSWKDSKRTVETRACQECMCMCGPGTFIVDLDRQLGPAGRSPSSPFAIRHRGQSGDRHVIYSRLRALGALGCLSAAVYNSARCRSACRLRRPVRICIAGCELQASSCMLHGCNIQDLSFPSLPAHVTNTPSYSYTLLCLDRETSCDSRTQSSKEAEAARY